MVEDEALLREATLRHLKIPGFGVDAAPTLAKARLAMQTWRYDAVVLDRGLPDGDGVSLLEGDAAALAVAVRNMLENDRNHGRPTISVRVCGGEVVVSDHGDGFLEVEQAPEPFVSRQGRPGSELGLDIVRQVAVANQG